MRCCVRREGGVSAHEHCSDAIRSFIIVRAQLFTNKKRCKNTSCFVWISFALCRNFSNLRCHKISQSHSLAFVCERVKHFYMWRMCPTLLLLICFNAVIVQTLLNRRFFRVHVVALSLHRIGYNTSFFLRLFYNWCMPNTTLKCCCCCIFIAERSYFFTQSKLFQYLVLIIFV